MFECRERPADGESEVEFLQARGELSPGELDVIRERTLSLVEYNRGRTPPPTPAGHCQDNFIPPDDVHRFAAAHGLIDPAQAAVLGLDAEGRDLHPRGELDPRIRHTTRPAYYPPSVRRLASS
jgi:hypothetical protein